MKYVEQSHIAVKFLVFVGNAAVSFSSISEHDARGYKVYSYYHL